MRKDTLHILAVSQEKVPNAAMSREKGTLHILLMSQEKVPYTAMS